MLFDTKFDLIFSLGENCACTSYIRRYNLQNFSFPFDWIRGGNLGIKIEYLINDFQGFCSKENLELLETPENSTETKCDYYRDKISGLYFIHDFKKEIPFDEAFSEVMEKYNRRIERLYNEINNSKKILMIWYNNEGEESIHNLQNYYRKLKKKFGEKEIYLLVLENSKNEFQSYFEENHVLVLRYNNTSDTIQDKQAIMGNQKRNMKIFAQIKKYIPIKELPTFVFYKITKILIGMVPSRKIRPILREYFDRNFYKAKL